MTFYWWSHWFWITLLSNVVVPIAIVHTYPSQEISLDYNNANNEQPLKTVTRLYQATTLTWTAAGTPATPVAAHIAKLSGISAEKTLLQSVTPEYVHNSSSTSSTSSTSSDSGEELIEHEHIADNVAMMEQLADSIELDDDDFEFKRSAENYNKTNDNDNEHPALPEALPALAKATLSNATTVDDTPDVNTTAAASSTKLKRDDAEMNNFTNFSGTAQTASANTSSSGSGKERADDQRQQLASGVASNTTTMTSRPTSMAAGATPSPPHIDTASSSSGVEWLSAPVAAAAAPTPMTRTDISSAEDSDASASQRVPFTLENANKEEELRRAENEHRSRKSKVLSAEYKHINRFINYSADSKSLLARSASTAPNNFDGDESNISSEALAIQRTYFLDAGAISAICFTVFGVCCTVGTIGIVLYRRRYLNKPQALSEPDSSVYIDDSTMRVSDNSDEMYSLDNDSFLNSLEAMTIQNYWTDTVKHTKL